MKNAERRSLAQKIENDCWGIKIQKTFKFMKNLLDIKDEPGEVVGVILLLAVVVDNWQFDIRLLSNSNVLF